MSSPVQILLCLHLASWFYQSSKQTSSGVQGAEVDSLLTEQQYRRVVYCGDGENDLCPALHLAPGDLVLARKGYGLHKLLTKRASLPGEQQCKATVRLWATHAELAELLRKHAV